MKQEDVCDNHNRNATKSVQGSNVVNGNGEERCERVTLDVYGDGVDYVVTDPSYYTCNVGELQSRLGVSGASRSGCAIVERCDDGTVAPFKL